MVFLLKLFYRRAARQACYQILMGRMIQRDRPEMGRFLRHDADRVLKETWDEVDEILPSAELDRLPTFGNRHNVFLAIVTVACYHALINSGIERQYAIELVADLGWKLYTRFITLPRFVARLSSRDPHRQMGLILLILSKFPFNITGKPGYEANGHIEPECYCINYTFCPPYGFVKEYVEHNGDRGEIELFQRSWCWYDWAFAYAMVDGGYQKLGHYERPHTLSSGDEVCDMRWYGRPPQG